MVQNTRTPGSPWRRLYTKLLLVSSLVAIVRALLARLEMDLV